MLWATLDHMSVSWSVRLPKVTVARPVSRSLSVLVTRPWSLMPLPSSVKPLSMMATESPVSTLSQSLPKA